MIYLFWSSIFWIWYAYLGYPLLLWILSLFYQYKKQEYSNEKYAYKPMVSLLISAYNEEEIIETKIINSLNINYPKRMMEIVVISDGSNDKTNQIVENFTDFGVVLKHYKGRLGKTACLNKAVPSAKGEIIVFSDANSLYDKDAITHLVKHFSDKTIGYVTGHTKYSLVEGSDELKPIGIYSSIERITKRLETKIGSCVGADGAIFAIRKQLYEPLKDYDINDFVIPLMVKRKGFRGVLEDKAYCTESTAKDTKGEFKRQTRITNRTIRAIFNNATMLNPMKFSLFSFELISHKLSKYLVPFFLIILFISNINLLSVNKFYSITLGAQIILYLSSFFKYSVKHFRLLSKINSFMRTFVTVNLAILLGWIHYLSGIKYTTWSTKR